jgi:hypothetical protein
MTMGLTFGSVISMKFMWKIFLVTFLFSLAVAILSNSYKILILTIRNLSAYDYGALLFLLSVVSFFISPALFFGVLYLIGRNLDFATEFMSVVISLFLGCWLGHLVGFFTIEFVYITNYDSALSISQLLYYFWYIFPFAFSSEFFIGFTAVSMAHIKKS